MSLTSFTAEELFNWLTTGEDFLLLDVRNDVEFARFKVEGPRAFDMLNVPYMEFIEHEEESVAKVPKGKPVRIVCAKEGSSKYVGEILVSHGFEDVAHMLVGIKAWGNLLMPIQVHAEDDWALYQFRRPGKASLSYGLVSGQEMMLFDPAKNIQAYQQFADDRGLAITHTFETHRQADYISGSPMLKKALNARILAPQADFEGARFDYTAVEDQALYHFSQGGPAVKVVHTPGHTPGSTCYMIAEKFIVTGDTVFILSIGRPDLGGMAEAWSQLLFDTMTRKLLAMDPAIQVLPGHYMDWREANPDLIFIDSLGNVIKNNQDIYGITDARDFYAFIKANMRPQPEEYAKIREINAGLVAVDDDEQEIMDIGKNECAASMHHA
jgi:glyoxylase-like metal-dependent hydrolase (beta-lactamase superfamily II)